MTRLPTISIITPSFNQAQFLEQTIRSVLCQRYPGVEHIVVDGGSTDGSIDILKKYSSSIIWSSRKDNGQSDAINIGMQKATGAIIGYLNSDDYLERGALEQVGSFFSRSPHAHWVTGKCFIVDADGRTVRPFASAYKNFFLRNLRTRNFFSVVQFISQPSTFWRREVVADIGFFDVSLAYDMDYDYWFRIWKKYPLFFLDSYLSSYRLHASSKAVRSPETQFRVEHEIARRHTSSRFLLFLHRLHVAAATLLYTRFFRA